MSQSPTSSHRQRPELITGDEELLRAITTAYYDRNKGRPTSALFKGKGISVSRSAVLPTERIEEIFVQTLPRPERNPPIEYLGYASVWTTALRELAEENDAIEALAVRADPLPKNEAHAEIIGEVKKGLSREILSRSDFVLQQK